MSGLPEVDKTVARQLRKLHISEWTISGECDFGSNRSEIACILENSKDQRRVRVVVPTEWFYDQSMHDGIGALIKRAISTG
jgi:hypothetical protein